MTERLTLSLSEVNEYMAAVDSGPASGPFSLGCRLRDAGRGMRVAGRSDRIKNGSGCSPGCREAACPAHLNPVSQAHPLSGPCTFLPLVPS